MESHILANWMTGRGKRDTYKAEDVLFVTITTLNHVGNWDFLVKMFGMKGPTFKRLVISFIFILSDLMYTKFLQDWERSYTMAIIRTDCSSFKYHKYVLYATVVTVRQSNRPSGNNSESKKCFSNKNKMYGYKVQV